MPLISCSALQGFFELYSDKPAVKNLKKLLDDNIQKDNISVIISIYKESVALIESQIFSNNFDDALIDLFHQVFHEFEILISQTGDDNRHEFIVVIPVADRPQHLKACLQSILELCEKFNYGGFLSQKYSKISVIVADDSKEDQSIIKNKEISQHYNDQGIKTLYFGQHEQLREVDRLIEADKQALVKVLGDIDRSEFSHKGASIMRNITYLKLHSMVQKDKKQLFYFIDSDQEFKLKVNCGNSDKNLYIKNFFYELDEIFSKSKVDVLTGKVVGDPPVSPAVMAGNFIDDVTGFLNQMAKTTSDTECQFHNIQHQKMDDASYHDMANLFGFKSAQELYQYKCPLSGNHNNEKCFNKFSSELSRFFYGEHPTRKTYYEHEEALSSVKTARTVYTGNYIFKPESLKYFIPFATLKLRMAGPVLGRIIKSEINEKFVSANLPMLHKRTVANVGESEFRPGINKDRELIDLSGEFERQFFGDVMLFTIEKLTDLGYPENELSEDIIDKVLCETEEKIFKMYQDKHEQIKDKLTLLISVFNDRNNWWNSCSDFNDAKNSFDDFINNIEHNFGDKSYGYELISSKHHKKKRHSEILDAVMSYTADRAAWQKALAVIH